MVVGSMRRSGMLLWLMQIDWRPRKELTESPFWVRQPRLCLPRRLCFEPTSGKRWDRPPFPSGPIKRNGLQRPTEPQLPCTGASCTKPLVLPC